MNKRNEYSMLFHVFNIINFLLYFKEKQNIVNYSLQLNLLPLILYKEKTLIDKRNKQTY